MSLLPTPNGGYPEARLCHPTLKWSREAPAPPLVCSNNHINPYTRLTPSMLKVMMTDEDSAVEIYYQWINGPYNFSMFEVIKNSEGTVISIVIIIALISI